MMLVKKDRLARERHTIQVMIEIYCRGHHQQTESPCAECQQLWAYAQQRLDKCPYQDDKPTCAQCPTHCYKPAMREQVRQVMRYAGPRMMLYHPLLALFHYLDEMIRAGRSKAELKGKH
ncbi:MAG: nitrous oxide-stimulated promoter family protein [Candidatus Latescibacteria bacterium]|nr:nitrous oxide-stimulated promoter family protein [Candidatus Latescibacterota bacterium]